MSQEKYIQNLGKYFDTEISKEEKAKIQSELNSEDLQNSEKAWGVCGKLYNRDCTQKISNLKASLFGDTDTSTTPSSTSFTSPKKSRVRRLVFMPTQIRYAAAVSLLIMASFAVWFSQDQHNGEYVAIKATNYLLRTVLPDGTQVKMYPNAEIHYFEGSFGADHRTVEAIGNIQWNVAKNKELPFVIEGTRYMVEVLGTQFLTYQSAEAPYVWVKEGVVKCYLGSDLDKAVMLKKNTKAVLNLGDNEFATTSEIFEEHNLDLLSEFTFSNTKAEQVFDILSDAFGVEIEVNAKSAKTKKLTASFEKDRTVDSILEAVCRALRFEYELKETGVYFVTD